jgi:hypothetical protein
MAQPLEVSSCQRFCQDVSGVVGGPYTSKLNGAIFNKFPGVMELHPKVFDVGVTDVVLR